MNYEALLVDLDGVVTDTASVHAAAWKRLFDEYLERRARREGTTFEPFDIDEDYRRYVDGKPRDDGVRSFLRSRHIELPTGASDDGPEAETVRGLGDRKNTYFREHLERSGVAVFPSTVRFVEDAKAQGLKVAVVSSSKNCAAVLDAAGLDRLFDVRVDGVDVTTLKLRGKPAPDLFLEAAARLGVAPDHAVVVEDAIAGVQAGRNGGFGLVIGVDRTGQADALRTHGADLVVTDLAELTLASIGGT